MKGFKRLPALGKRARVAPDSGWSAGALAGDTAIVVVVHGRAATEAAATTMLQEAGKRRSKQTAADDA